MATKKKTAKTATRKVQKRQERRFVSQSSTNPTVVRILGALAAMALGAGLYAYFYGQSFTEDDVRAYPSYIIAAGAVLMGITIWLGTSAESPIRVGAPGIAMEKGDIRRMPWWAIDKIRFEPGALALAITGKDESNVDWAFKVPVKTQPEAVGWIIKEAQERIPRRIDIPEETLAKMPGAPEHAGQRLDLDALQVVGKRCAVTGKTISYEPDAVVCPRCERVYGKRAVPKKCKCGNSLEHLRGPDADLFDEDYPQQETDDDIAEREKAET